VVIGVGIGFAGQFQILKRKFAQWVFWIWTAMWFVWAFGYVYTVRHPSADGSLLALFDLQTVLVVAAAWMVLEGDGLDWKDVVIPFTILFGVLVLWSLLMVPAGPASIGRRLAWVAPSETVAALSMPLMGFAFLVRYRVYGFPFLLVTIGYGGLQIAAYSTMFLGVQGLPENVFFLVLAVGKLLIGALFYGLFFFSLTGYNTILPPLEAADSTHLRSTIWRASAWCTSTFVVPLVVAVMAAWLKA
jgi:hypothetical protein